MKVLRWFLALAALAAIVAVASWEQQERTSPGPLHASHRGVAELGGSNGCALCHGDGSPAGMAAACGECHAAIRADVASGRGLHGALGERTARSCAQCHSEHHGDALALVADHAFRRAGASGRSGYRHEHVAGFGLDGRHGELGCEACHALADRASLARGERRFLGLEQRCTSCHEDAHEGRLGNDCARCHGQVEPFARPPGFLHRSFLLDGAHAEVACASCHEPDGASAVARLLEAPPEAARSCADCHQDPHRAGGRALPIADARDCARCHETRDFAGVSFTAGDHARSGVVLEGRHAAGECGACHAETARLLAAGVARAEVMQGCVECHDSAHRGAFLERVAAHGGLGRDRTCTLCHAAHHETFTAPDATLERALHAATGFPLEAPHAAVACAGCHAPAASFAERYPGRSPDGCAACHADPHRGEFGDLPARGDCRQCHAATHFMPSDFDLGRHARTGFPLTGAHQAVACATCHEPARVPRFTGTPRECAACHADPHGGTFERAGVPTVVEGRVGCARCHDTGSFGAVREGAFDHERWTGWPLRGAHARASCAACHPPVPRGADRRATARAERACASCHADPHAGQFAERDALGRVARAADCARCHAEGDAFTLVGFDHDRDSRFRLDATHASLACARCHRAEELPDGRRVVRYRPLGTTCADCHGPRRGAGGVR